ncbi:MAG: hypothetical protein CVU05_02200 [Bacteroidetes bacterium HGW-Bacteroidetes-21]|nr:MAG: hypothetical protein CVU05_02200 [Bacteroidetes bacterium HGW-Bacteroidetes-21]
MRNAIFFLTLISLFGLRNSVNAQITSIANGNWSNPLTWGGVPPTPGSTVIINHAVILDMDYGYSSGSITINSSGSLDGVTPLRGLGISGGTLTNNGNLSIARLALNSGTIENNGTMENDSLICFTSLTNNTGSTILAGQFMISTNGTFTNNGTVVSDNFLNISSVTSNGNISSFDLMNSKTFTNGSTGIINVGHNFLNSDSITSPAIFTNNGNIAILHDWRNTDQINGTGKFCVQNNTNNSGEMTGSFDFCDQTGGGIDLNTGNVSGSITYCQFPCSSGITVAKTNQTIEIYPNPSNGSLFVEISGTAKSLSSDILLYNSLGSLIWKNNANEKQFSLDFSQFPKGIYYIRINNDGNYYQKTIIFE